VRALISISDKTGLAAFAGRLVDLGYDLVASGGTAAYLQEHGLPVTAVEDVTAFPELLEGRVKTLHPRIHAGILARADRDDDLEALDAHGIGRFGLVCVNLYPFEREPGVELIDIGGPALLRAAAKNHEHVAVVSSPTQYEAVLDEVAATGGLSLDTRRRLAAEAFAHTAAYDARIAEWFAAGEEFPARRVVALEKHLDLVYGENPHQRGAFYADRGAPAHLLGGAEKLQGRELSVTNLLDLAHGRALVAEFGQPACTVVKHANPSGAAVGATAEEAFRGALECDPVSAFGMVCVLNRPVDEALGQLLAERVVDLVWAPAYDDGALAALRQRPATRVLRGPGNDAFGGLDWKRVPGGFLVQQRDRLTETRADMEVVCGTVPEDRWDDVLFAWRVCAHVSSNAIVIAREGRTLGIGSGQVSRVDSVRLALDKARAYGHLLEGAVLASDGFFPFADGPELALEAGVATIVQPGGSKRDAEVIAAVEVAGAAMVFTGRRHFRH
jgi:phosphoribosylaminoimidazolecarboxamide formyltransferase/IMP cyclohydrolase